ncbi:Peptidase M14 carboxypeptidase A domain-containing protein [Plasmodiophora brassicae]|uniref:Succinylglutamate desuccinylase/Aspartoacylase catalytic domain-containing protein n=1 Tax=Plasmodiophora brassicae TaxID=37360 RepID=A0A3P3YG17_PLABS|nr:unnamed protein product [Plasmodiophora brassicae]
MSTTRDAGPSPRGLLRNHSIDDILYYFSSKPVVTIPTVQSLVIDEWPTGQISVMWVETVSDSFGSPVCVPVMLAKGAEPGGTVVGLTAALHGNESSGIPTIQKIFHSLSHLVMDMKGSVVAIPCCNQYGFQTTSRFYVDGADLNRSFLGAGLPGDDRDPSKETRARQFARNLFDRVLRHCTLILDLHTASFGRDNSFYVRGDMRSRSVARIARWLQPQIIVHHVARPDRDGTLRAACTANGIDCLAVQIGECVAFDRDLIHRTYTGIVRVLDHLGVVDAPDMHDLNETMPPTIACVHSYWIHTIKGGILDVYPNVGDRVVKGQCIASVVDIFGFVQAKVKAPEDGVVVGKSTNPSNVQGDRIVHLGVPAPDHIVNDDGSLRLEGDHLPPTRPHPHAD